MLQRRGFKISGSAAPMYMEGCESMAPLKVRPRWFSHRVRPNRGQDIQNDEEIGIIHAGTKLLEESWEKVFTKSRMRRSAVSIRIRG